MWEPRKLFGTYTYNPDWTKTYSITAKSRFYGPTGQGRDDYIFRNNGGLYPQHDPWKNRWERRICVSKAEIYRYNSNNSFKECYVLCKWVRKRQLYH